MELSVRNGGLRKQFGRIKGMRLFRRAKPRQESLPPTKFARIIDEDHKTEPTDSSFSPTNGSVFESIKTNDFGSTRLRNTSCNTTLELDPISFAQLEVGTDDSSLECGRTSSRVVYDDEAVVVGSLAPQPCEDDDDDEIGTEVVLFSDATVTETTEVGDRLNGSGEGLFLSFNDLGFETRENPPPTSPLLRPKKSNGLDKMERDYSRHITITVSPDVPPRTPKQVRQPLPEPASSVTPSSDGLTWMSHDLSSNQDHRPLREISIPTPSPQRDKCLSAFCESEVPFPAAIDLDVKPCDRDAIFATFQDPEPIVNYGGPVQASFTSKIARAFVSPQKSTASARKSSLKSDNASSAISNKLASLTARESASDVSFRGPSVFSVPRSTPLPSEMEPAMVSNKSPSSARTNKSESVVSLKSASAASHKPGSLQRSATLSHTQSMASQKSGSLPSVVSKRAGVALPEEVEDTKSDFPMFSDPILTDSVDGFMVTKSGEKKDDEPTPYTPSKQHRPTTMLELFRRTRSGEVPLSSALQTSFVITKQSFESSKLSEIGKNGFVVCGGTEVARARSPEQVVDEEGSVIEFFDDEESNIESYFSESQVVTLPPHPRLLKKVNKKADSLVDDDSYTATSGSVPSRSGSTRSSYTGDESFSFRRPKDDIFQSLGQDLAVAAYEFAHQGSEIMKRWLPDGIEFA